MESAQKELLAAMCSLFQTGKFSDLTILCGPRRYHVHKALLCSRSHFFDGACNGHFAESKVGEIDLSDEDQEAVAHMVKYFYHLDYSTDRAETRAVTQRPVRRPPPKLPKPLNIDLIEDPLVCTATAASNPNSPVSPSFPMVSEQLQLHKTNSAQPPSPSPFSAVGVSRRASIPRTDPLAMVGMTSALPDSGKVSETDPTVGSHNDDNDEGEEEEERASADAPALVIHARVYALAEKFGIQGLKEVAQNKFEMLANQGWNEPEFLDATEEVYSSTIGSDRGLRNIIVQAFRQQPELATRPEVRHVVQNLAPLAFDLYRVSCGVPLE